MSKDLSAVVIGAGWAGEGHTKALRYCGVDVHTICARNPEVTRAVAERLEIPNASTDWRATLEETRPDIVAIATPASLRLEPIELAAALGCHIYCDKPLAVDAPTAKECYQAAQAAGVKTAYAATGRYGPGEAWMAEQIAAGVVGTVRAVDVVARSPGPMFGGAPWTWMDSLALGGGMLNNGFTHAMGTMELVLGRPAIRAMGTASVGRRRAYVLPDMHDFRQIWGPKPSEEELASLEWRECDGDGEGAAVLEVAAQGDRPAVTVTCTFSSNLMAVWPPAGYRFIGDAGTLVADGMANVTNVRLWTEPGTDPTPLPTPQRLIDAIPAFEGDGDYYTQGKWAALARDFVADIRGEDHAPYLTFADGYRYQVAIDAIRSGAGWTELA